MSDFDLMSWIRRAARAPISPAARSVCLQLIPLIENDTGALSVENGAQLRRALDIPRRSLSRHLKELRGEGLLSGLVCVCGPDLAHTTVDERPHLAHCVPNVAHSKVECVPDLAPPITPIKDLPITPKISADPQEAAALTLTPQSIKEACGRLPSNARPDLGRLNNWPRSPLTTAQIFEAWESATGEPFGSWPVAGWRACAPRWVAIVRYLVDLEEWQSVCGDVAGAGVSDRPRLPWITKALNTTMRSSGLKRGRPQDERGEVVPATDTKAGAAALRNALSIIQGGQ